MASPGLSGRRRGGAIASRDEAGLPRKVAVDEVVSPTLFAEALGEQQELDLVARRCQMFEYAMMEHEMFIDHYM